MGRPPLDEGDPLARGWGRQGPPRCALGKVCSGAAGCLMRDQTREEHGSREVERSAPLERWTPPGNEAKMRQEDL